MGWMGREAYTTIIIYESRFLGKVFGIEDRRMSREWVYEVGKEIPKRELRIPRFTRNDSIKL